MQVLFASNEDGGKKVKENPAQRVAAEVAQLVCREVRTGS